MRDQHRSQIDIVLAFLTIFVIVILDRLTKNFFVSNLELHESLSVIPRFLFFTMVHNSGIAFGMFKGQGTVFILIPIILTIWFIINLYYYKKNDEVLDRTYIFGFSLILGGAYGNLIDRVAYGYVIDFIDFRFWPVFNIADSAITIGAIIIALKCFLLTKK